MDNDEVYVGPMRGRPLDLCLGTPEQPHQVLWYRRGESCAICRLRVQLQALIFRPQEPPNSPQPIVQS